MNRRPPALKPPVGSSGSRARTSATPWIRRHQAIALQPHHLASVGGQRFLAAELSLLQDVEDLVHELLDAEPERRGLGPNVSAFSEREVLANLRASAESVGQRQRVSPVGLDPHLALRPQGP